MEAIQLELFDEKPQLITKIKILKDWILIDNCDRDIEESVKLKHHYPLVVSLNRNEIYGPAHAQSLILPIDEDAKKIDMLNYFKVSNVLRLRKMIYNKKKFQLENIK